MTTKYAVRQPLLLLLLGFLVATHAQVLQNNGTECRLLTYIPFTDIRPGAPGDHANPDSYGYGFWPSAESLAEHSFGLLAAAELARRDFNERNPVVVKELEGLGACNVRIPDTSIYADSEYWRQTVVADFLARQFQSSMFTSTTDSSSSTTTTPGSRFCSVIGPVETEGHQGLSPNTETFGIPQIAYKSIQSQLSRADLFPTFARIIPEGQDWGLTLAKAVHRDIWLREYLAIIYEPDYGDQFESPLEDAEDELDNFLTITEEVEEGSDESIYDALGEVISEGYRTIMYIGDRFELLDDVARVADDLGLLGEGYFWIISGAAVPPAMMKTVRETPGSSLDKMLDGAAVFTNFDPFVYEPTGDRFLSHWQKQTAEFVDQVVTMQPRKPDGSLHYQPSQTYFQDKPPVEYTSFIYDAVIAAGISACAAAADSSSESSAVPNAHYQQLLATSFTGASGLLRFKSEDGEEFENTRDFQDLTFGFHNIRPTAVGDDGLRGYEMPLFATFKKEHTFLNSDGEEEEGAWRLLPGEEFFFFGNTTVEPLPRRTVADANFISEGSQRTGLTLVALGIAVNVGSAAWIFVHRQKRFVKAGQPEFLYMLCLGSLMVAISLVFVSFDENQGWTEKQLDRGCSTFPWLFVTGYLTMYCALMSKLWRLSKLMQLRRQKVTVLHVLGPFAALILCSFAVLTTWQINDPFVWRRDVINFDPLETYGECQVEGSLLAYIVPLGFLIMIVTVSTAVFAWKLKDVQSDLSESRWIFFGIFTHLQTWAVGIPVVVITDDTSRDAFYIMLAGLSFVFSTTMVGFVVWPKIFEWFRDEYLGHHHRPTIQISTKGVSQSRISGLDLPAMRSGYESSVRHLASVSEMPDRNENSLNQDGSESQIERGPVLSVPPSMPPRNVNNINNTLSVPPSMPPSTVNNNNKTNDDDEEDEDDEDDEVADSGAGRVMDTSDPTSDEPPAIEVQKTATVEPADTLEEDDEEAASVERMPPLDEPTSPVRQSTEVVESTGDVV